MKKILFYFLLVLISSSNYAQTSKSLLGTWYVAEVIIPKDSFPRDKPGLYDSLITAFRTCSFQFEDSGKFVFNFSFKEMQVPDGEWTYDAIKKVIKVTEKDDPRSTLMEISVESNQEREIYFMLIETPIILKMRKK